MLRGFDDLPEELKGCCAGALDTSTAGRFGRVNKACKELVAVRLAGDKAARDRAVLEKVSSRWGEALAATWRVADGPNLVTFCDGGPKLFKCMCMQDKDKEYDVGRGAANLARHLASRRHFKHWQVMSVGEADDEAAWLAFAASLPGDVAPMPASRRRI